MKPTVCWAECILQRELLILELKFPNAKKFVFHYNSPRKQVVTTFICKVYIFFTIFYLCCNYIRNVKANETLIIQIHFSLISN